MLCTEVMRLGWLFAVGISVGVHRRPGKRVFIINDVNDSCEGAFRNRNGLGRRARNVHGHFVDVRCDKRSCDVDGSPNTDASGGRTLTKVAANLLISGRSKARRFHIYHFIPAE
jgi:hypothetical protein